MPKSLFVRDIVNLENVFFGCIMVAEGTLKFLRAVFFHHIILIMLIFGIGTLFILLREFVFFAAPHIKHGAGIVAVVIDALEVIFYVFFEVFTAIFDVTSDIIFGIKFLVCKIPGVVCHLKSKPTTIPFRKMSNQSFVSPGQVRQALDRVTVACVKYDSVPEMISLALRKFLGPTVCPMVRYLYPVPFLYEAALQVAWFTPDPTPLGYAGENNCQVSEAARFDFVCTGMGFGYIVNELLLPLFIGILLLSAMAIPVLHLTSVLLRFAATATRTVYRVVHFIVTSMDESLIWLIDEALVFKGRHGFKRSKNRPATASLPSRS